MRSDLGKSIDSRLMTVADDLEKLRKDLLLTTAEVSDALSVVKSLMRDMALDGDAQDNQED